jgi:flagellin-like protein
MFKKAEMGVGTLIIFIAMLLVAAVAAGVLLQTAGSLQEKSLATGQQARGQISTNVRAIEVSATNGQDGAIDDYAAIYKLSPGSEPIKLSNVLMSQSTDNSTVSLKLREDALPVKDVFAGYYTVDRSAHRESLPADAVPRSFSNIFGTFQPSEMMIGKIAVAIVFVESDGAIDTNYENWTAEEEQSVIDATAGALDWWAQIDPRSDLSYTIEAFRQVPISYEPITRDTSSSNQTLWMTEALDGIGAPAGGNRFTRSYLFDDELRHEKNSHWSFIFFAVDSSHTGTGFSDGYAGIAYINGPFTFIATSAYDPYPEALFAHEFAHIFGANDEYASSLCNCTDTTGYYPIETQNCDTAGCLMNESSIMRGGMDTINAYLDDEVDVFARAQLGLIDANGNHMLDPVDLLFGGDQDGADMSQAAINSLVGNYEVPSYEEGVGFFAKSYLQEGTNHVENNLQRGDIVKLSFESDRPIDEDERVRISLIPKIGTTTLTEFVTPDVITVERVYLYP